MIINKVKLTDIQPASYNPRVEGAVDEQLDKSIDEFGMLEPLVVNSREHKDFEDHKPTIVGGHQRYYALQRRGEVEADVVWVNLSPISEKKANLALNKISGEWDDEKLFKIVNEFEDLGEDFEVTGFSEDEIDAILRDMSEIDEDEVPEVPQKAESKLGEIYQLGRHRLMCGDSTNVEHVEKLMDGNKADMVFTDPPYGMNLDTDYSSLNSNPQFVKEKHLKSMQGNKYDKVIGDSEDYDPTHLFTMFPNVKEMFLWGGDYYSERLQDKNKGSWIVWDKRNENENLDKMFGSQFELCWSKTRHKREIARIQWAGVFGTEKEFDHKRHHPTQKPIALSSWFIKRYSKENELIIDLFGGSGSTLIACEQTDRICYMSELDPLYCDVIRKRYENYKKSKA